MLNISTHPVWNKVNLIKKQGHLIRLFLASQYAKLIPRSTFIGVTGSVGKTTTVSAISLVLSQKYPTISTSANLDPIFNLPITILKKTPKIKKVVLEMGVEYPGEMDFYLNLVKPEIAVITRIFYQHSEFLGDIEKIAEEKGKLLEQLPKSGYAILNYDDPQVRKMASKTIAQIVFFGKDPKNCHVWAGNLKLVDFETVFELNYGVERVEVKTQLLGFHQVYPLLAAAAVGICQDIPITKIKKALEMVEPAPHRLQAMSGFNNSVVLDDTYNAAPIAVEEALDTLNLLPARRRIAVLGEMRELGKYSEKMHREIAQKIYKDKIDLVFLGTGDTKFILDELLRLGFVEERVFSDLNNHQIVSKLLRVLGKGDVVLVKGARAVRLDEVVQRILRAKK